MNAVRAFEAAARYQSLVRAADELCVTPTAVSHQIRLLEDFLQFKLFLRKNSRLELTPDSRACLGKLTHALDLIDDALMTLREPKQVRERVMIGASASVASLWLMPRIHNFVRDAPEIDVSVTTFVERAAIEAETANLWICNWQTALDRRIEPLMEEEIIPVCSPLLAQTHGALALDSLRELPLIHVDRNRGDFSGQYPDWDRYLREYGIARNTITSGLRFNQAGSAIEAAKAGMGALLGRSILVEAALQRGELVQIAEAYPVRSPYYLVSPWRQVPGAVNKFKDWLFRQVPSSRHVRLA